MGNQFAARLATTTSTPYVLSGGINKTNIILSPTQVILFEGREKVLL